MRNKSGLPPSERFDQIVKLHNSNRGASGRTTMTCSRNIDDMLNGQGSDCVQFACAYSSHGPDRLHRNVLIAHQGYGKHVIEALACFTR